MPSRTVNVVSFGLLGVVALAVILLVMAAWLQWGALRGEARHDFGLVWIEDDQAAATHTFRLLNRSADPVVVLDMKSSCGCTVATANQNILAPGETLEVPTTLTLSATGPKKATIDVMYDQEGRSGRKTLFVQAVGRRRKPLRAERGELQVTPGVTTRMALLLEDLETDARPPDPEFQAPARCEVSFTGWDNKQARKPDETLPAVWRGSVLVRLIGEDIPDGEILKVTVPPGREVKIRLVEQVILRRQQLPLPGPQPDRRPDPPATPPEADPA